MQQQSCLAADVSPGDKKNLVNWQGDKIPGFTQYTEGKSAALLFVPPFRKSPYFGFLSCMHTVCKYTHETVQKLLLLNGVPNSDYQILFKTGLV